MTSQDPPNGESPSTSALSEAVEQLADSAGKWSKDLTGFLKHEADKLSVGDYRLNDLVTAPVRLMSICVKDTLDTVFTISDNLSLISSARSGAPPPPRTMRVTVTIPANAAVRLVPTEMKGQSGHRIPPSYIKIEPDNFIESAKAVDVDVVVTVTSPHAPNDVYEGFLCSADPAIEVPFAVTIHELGLPLL